MNDINGIIQKTGNSGLLLNESESKQMLKEWGISVPKSFVVKNLKEAKEAAAMLGFPVVIKGLPEGIIHKSEYNLIQVGVQSVGEIETSFSNIVENCIKSGKTWDILIEEQISGVLEIVVGLTTDPNFGKVMMFGLGGIFVEIIKDVSFKLCPITRRDAEDMIETLQGSKIFSGVRGKKQINKDKLVDFMLIIGGHNGVVKKKNYDIDTLEINPAIIDESGNVTALDAVIRLSSFKEIENSIKDSSPVDMNRLFNPQTLGVAGISPDRNSFAKDFLKASLDMGYKGKVFPLNIKHDGEKVYGWRIYDRINAIPSKIDYLYVSVPANRVLGLLKDGKDKVRFAHIITSGFGEVGEDGKEIEKSLIEQARESNIRLIGPNCLGMYSPDAGITLIEGAPKESGNIGIISQSGGLTTDIIRMGGAIGLRFSKAVSIGNSIDLSTEDFLEYMGNDPQTKIIGIYVEHVKNGERLSRLLSKICKAKPVLILKGGRNPLGSRAASSHTGALASDTKIWEAMCRQHGSVYVKSFNEFINGLLAFQNLDHEDKNTLFMFGQSGGTTVLAADLCGENEIEVPEFDQKLVNEILSLGIPPGTSVINPIDAPIGTLAVDDGLIVKKIFELVEKRHEFAYDLMHFNVQNILSYSQNGIEIINNMVNFAIETGGINGPRNRNLVLVIRGNKEKLVEDVVREYTQKALKAGVPVYCDLCEALKSLSLLIEYGSWFKKNIKNMEIGLQLD